MFCKGLASMLQDAGIKIFLLAKIDGCHRAAKEIRGVTQISMQRP